MEGVRFLEWKLKVDDPVGAIAVHGICGIWGTLAVGLFDIGGQGLFYGGGFGLLGIQAIGVIATIAWVSVSVAAGLLIIKAFVPLRVTAEEEIAGLDVMEHGTPAYEYQDIFKSSAVRGETFAHRLTHFGKAQNNVQEEQHV